MIHECKYFKPQGFEIKLFLMLIARRYLSIAAKQLYFKYFDFRQVHSNNTVSIANHKTILGEGDAYFMMHSFFPCPQTFLQRKNINIWNPN